MTYYLTMQGTAVRISVWTVRQTVFYDRFHRIFETNFADISGI